MTQTAEIMPPTNLPAVIPFRVEGGVIEFTDVANPEEMFKPGGADDIIEAVETLARSVPRDISTDKGRAAIKSLRHSIRRSKAFLDKVGKELGADYHRKKQLIDSERNKIDARLVALEEEIYAELEAFEIAEKARVCGHEDAIRAMNDLASGCQVIPSEEVVARRSTLAQLYIRDWQEFGTRANAVHEEVAAALQDGETQARKREAEAAELERLRKEEAERQRLADEKRIRDEAAAKAKAESDAEIQRQKEIADQAIADKKRAEDDAAAEKERADQLQKDSDAKAKKAADDAAAAERQRQLDKEAADKAAEDARMADVEHRKGVNIKAMDALIAGAALTPEQAMAVIRLIVKGEVPHVKILY